MTPARFRVLLVATLLAVQLGTVAVFVEDARVRTAEALDASARAALAELADATLERTRDFLRNAEAPLLGTTALVAIGWLSPDDDAALERHFLVQLRGRPWLRALHVGRADGSLLSVARDGEDFRVEHVRPHGAGPGHDTIDYVGADGKSGARLEHARPFDPRSRPWYRAARGDGVGWVAPFVAAGRTSGAAAALELPRTAGTVPAVLGIDVDLEIISGFVARFARSEGGLAAVVAADGTIVGASAEGWLGRGADGRLPTLRELEAEETGSGGLGSLAAAAGGRAEAIPIEWAGRRGLGLVRELPETGWRLLVKVPVDADAVALGTYFSTRLHSLLGALALLAVVATVTVLGMSVPFARFHRDATTDALTGALTRAEFERRLDERMRRHRRGEERLVVIGLDLDGFKAVNDAHGHAAGDEVLVAFVRRLSGRLRRDDLIGRPGGDEFLLALTLPLDEDPRLLVDSIRRSVVAEPVRGRHGSYSVGATAGIACHDSAEDTRASLLERADRALVNGKCVAKNHTYVADLPQPAAPSAPALSA